MAQGWKPARNGALQGIYIQCMAHLHLTFQLHISEQHQVPTEPQGPSLACRVSLQFSIFHLPVRVVSQDSLQVTSGHHQVSGCVHVCTAHVCKPPCPSSLPVLPLLSPSFFQIEIQWIYNVSIIQEVIQLYIYIHRR